MEGLRLGATARRRWRTSVRAAARLSLTAGDCEAWSSNSNPGLPLTRSTTLDSAAYGEPQYSCQSVEAEPGAHVSSRRVFGLARQKQQLRDTHLSPALWGGLAEACVTQLQICTESL